MDTLDYSGPKINHGSKGLLVGCGAPIRQLPREFHGELPRGVRKAVPFCGGCLVVEGSSFEAEPDIATRVAQASAFSQWPLVVVVDDCAKATKDESAFLWTTFTRFEPAADMYALKTEVARHHLSYTPPVVIDARMKPWYPPEVECDDKTQALVDERWSEYFSVR